MKFEVGDVVRCVDGCDCYLKVGENYRVKGYGTSFDGMSFVQVETMKGNSMGGWREDRFELVKVKEMENVDKPARECVRCKPSGTGSNLDAGKMYELVEVRSGEQSGLNRLEYRIKGSRNDDMWYDSARFYEREEVKVKVTVKPARVAPLEDPCETRDRKHVNLKPYFETTPYNHFPDLEGWSMNIGYEGENLRSFEVL